MHGERELISEIRQIMEQSIPAHVSNSLRIILFDYLLFHDDFPIDIKEILQDINILFDLLNAIKKLDNIDSTSL
jgi:hypothetical protein